MALPPGFLDELRARTSLSQVVGRKVMWDQRKSNQGKGDMWAPCPFHHEKTASFHVDDRKGYYYCFGCHAKGDAISFVRETENVDFMEAVRILAGEAGLPMPERDPEAQKKADRRTLMVEVMEQAVQYFRLQLKTLSGSVARDYLAGRELDDAACDRWDIGFVPEGWQGLWDHLTGKGVDPQLILDCGLAKPSSKGGKPYDTFRNRIMFPIRDARGRCIAFGGRAMDPNDNAKYLNSPETLLFDKSRTLFNHGPARAAVGKGHDLIVAEGYMDVIALVEAGFEGAVAPLGTAITEYQLQMLWRIAPEPVIALDGDTAGQRAMGRLIDLALPLLSQSNSLFFLTFPDGDDPDDFLKKHKAEGLRAYLGEHRTALVQALWRRELNETKANARVMLSTDLTPEQKAGLDKRLRALIGKIADPDIKRYYGEALKEYRWSEFKPNNWAPEFRRKPGSVKGGHATASARNSLLARGGQSDNLLSVQTDEMHKVRERVVAAMAMANPETAYQFRDGLEQFEITDKFARLAVQAMLAWEPGLSQEEARAALEDAIGHEAFATLLGDRFVRIHPCVKGAFDADIVLHEMAENIARVTADRMARLEMIEAEEDIDDVATEVLTYRLGQSALARNEANKGETEDRASYDVANNGFALEKGERDAFEALLKRITAPKPQR
ncbi:MAG: DNA primase [Rhodobacterales bacterium]|nr:MAG: DNA primase [Rhodobacterales bacterium]